MSTARHVIALLKSYLEGEEQQFFSVALQMAIATSLILTEFYNSQGESKFIYSL
ncbi:hypothetical protein [Nostoc sp. 2RC]|uniref:hypothetical protein n=1 Tax=Nostoc sp. 2RC TaxID=2485484 RepID=UPI00162494B1|nr:hypothetical protein [Nostoc sp. 2RC]MBC1236863.1 hypothetical protein [Nostoc sp. 2RC]